jgi:peptide/nickel transport system permease protein
MGVFVTRRLIGLVIVLFAISVLTFLIFFATPGVDPTRAFAGRNPTPQTIAAVRHQFGLDRSKPVQYLLMMKRIWIVFAILTGVAAVVFKGTILDPLLMIIALIGISMPVFWLGEVANLLTQDRLHHTFLFHWVPPLGYAPLTSNPWQWFLHLIIPWLTLSVLYIGFYARVLRANMLEVANEDYVRTARAKGLSRRRILIKHMLRMALIPFVSLFGLDFGVLVGGGALLTEVVFGLPGVGLLTYRSLVSLDLPVIMATVIYGAFFITIASAVVDIVYARLDPRIRYT